MSDSTTGPVLKRKAKSPKPAELFGNDVSDIHAGVKEFLAELPEPETQSSDDPPSNKPPVTAASSAPDPFDPASLRINPNTVAGAIGVKRKLVTLKVGKPNKQEYYRVHPDPAYRLETAVIEDKKNRETYLVSASLWREIPDEIELVRLCLAVNRHGEPLLWQARIPDPDRPNDWHTSMLEAQDTAVDEWTKVKSSMEAGSYAVYVATGNLPEPEWPELSLAELLRLAFKTRFIDSINHPFLQELFGQA